MKQGIQLAVIMMLCPLFVWAQETFSASGVYYKILSATDNTVEIVAGAEKYKNDVRLHTNVTYESKTYTVVAFGEEAFKDCTELTSVAFEYGEDASAFTEIKARAFMGCTSLSGYTIPRTVTAIGEQAFEGCTAMGYVDSEQNALYEVASRVIQRRAFAGCTNLGMMFFPTGVTAIGEEVCAGCTKLYQVNIPKSLTSIGTKAFYGCSAMKEYWIDDENPVYDDRLNGLYFYGIMEKSSRTLLYGGAYSTSQPVNIPEGMLAVAAYAYAQNKVLEYVVIPSTVTSIGEQAFYDCSNLIMVESNIIEPTSAEGVFNNASAIRLRAPFHTLKRYKAADGWKDFKSFEGTHSENDPAIVVTAKSYEITDEDALPTFEYTVTVDGAVGSDEDLDGTVSLSCSAASKPAIGTYTITVDVGQLKNQNVSYTNGKLTVKEAMKETFQKNGITYKVLSYEDKTLEVVAGAEKYSGSVMIPSTVSNGGEDFKVASIGAEAFKDCTGLLSVSMDEMTDFKEIKTRAFMGCTSLEGFRINRYVTSIGEQAFEGCSAMTYMYSVTNALDECASRVVGSRAFAGCSSLSAVSFPTGVTAIGDEALAGCSSLTSVSIGKTMSSIGTRVFADCPKLRAISIDSENSKYTNGADSYNRYFMIDASSKALLYGSAEPNQRTIIPEGVASIAAYAFAKNENLEYLSIPSTVTAIGEQAFAGCGNLAMVNSDIVAPFSVEGVFSNASNIRLSVPFHTLKKYKTTDGWKDFKTFEATHSTNDPAVTITAKSYQINVGDALPEKFEYTVSVAGQAGSDDDLDGTVSITYSGGSSPSAGEYTLSVNTDQLKNMNVTTVAGTLTVVASDPGSDPGTDPGTDPGSDPGTNPGVTGAVTGSLTIENLSNGIVEGSYCTMTFVIKNGTNTECRGSADMAFYDATTNKNLLTAGRGSIVIPPGESYEWSYTDGFNTSYLWRVVATFYPSGGQSITMGDETFRFSSDKVGKEDYYDSTTGLLFTYIDDATCYVMGYDGLNTANLEIPETVNGRKVVNIGYRALENCKNLKTVQLPATVTLIKDQAFSWCSGLTSVQIPSSVTTIGRFSFSGCSSLADVELSEGLETIKREAFYNCSALRSVALPNSVKTVENQAFARCGNMTKLSLPNHPVTYGQAVFQNCTALAEVYSYDTEPEAIDGAIFENYDSSSETTSFTSATLYVPQGTKEKYASLGGWRRFGSKIVEFDATGVQSLKAQSSVFDIYNLQGCKLRSGVSSFDGLPKGIYVIRSADGNTQDKKGKKVVVK